MQYRYVILSRLDSQGTPIVTFFSALTFTSYRRNCVMQTRHTILCSMRVELPKCVHRHTAGENGVTSPCFLHGPQS